MAPAIKRFEAAEWPFQAAKLIQHKINAFLLEQQHCSVMLTGGRTAERLYTAWAKQPSFSEMTGVQFYFGDERCVPADDEESNYGLVMRTLFHQGAPTGCTIVRIEAEDPDRSAAAIRYGEILPDKIDLLITGLGDDGHIASLFAGSEALQEVSQRVVPSRSPNFPYERITITPPVIAKAQSVFVLATGTTKEQILMRMLRQMPKDPNIFPARLVLNATWLMESPLASEPT